MYFNEDMDEISRILKHEEDNNNKLFSADELAKKELDEKEKELKEKLEKESVLKESEKEAILAEKEKELKRIEEAAEKDLSVKIQELNNEKKQNMEETVNFIVKNSFND